MALYSNISLQLNGNIVNTINKTWVIWEKSKKKDCTWLSALL